MANQRQQQAMASAAQEQRAKAWCFDNGITVTQMEACWNNAIEAGNFIIKNLDSHGKEWWSLPGHLLKEFTDKYSDVRKETDE